MVSRSARLFLERAGLLPTWREPLPRADPAKNPVVTQRQEPPPVSAPFQGPSQGDPPPDRGASQEWPGDL